MTPLREAITIGDVPTASLWLEHTAAGKAFERWVARMEALADPLLEDPERAAELEALIDSLEDGIALEEPGVQVLLLLLLAEPARFQVQAQRDRLARIAALVGLRAPRTADRERYERARQALIDRPVRRRRDEAWRLDRNGGLIPHGADVTVEAAAAAALAELRAACVHLCGLLSEDAVGRFEPDEPSYARLDVRCATNFFAALRQDVEALERLAGIARDKLGRPRRAR